MLNAMKNKKYFTEQIQDSFREIILLKTKDKISIYYIEK